MRERTGNQQQVSPMRLRYIKRLWTLKERSGEICERAFVLRHAALTHTFPFRTRDTAVCVYSARWYTGKEAPALYMCAAREHPDKDARWQPVRHTFHAICTHASYRDHNTLVFKGGIRFSIHKKLEPWSGTKGRYFIKSLLDPLRNRYGNQSDRLPLGSYYHKD